MLGILRFIGDAVAAAGQLVLYAIETALNAVISAFGALAAAVLGLLPHLPAAPGPPDSGVLQWISYIYPMGAMVAVVATFLALWVGFLIVRIPLRWVKAL